MFYKTIVNIRIIVLTTLLAISVIFSSQSESYAQKNDVTSLKKQFDIAFNKMLDDPSNIDVTMEYANIAVKLEDYESAIPALERILLFNPDLPRIKQELGVLYFKLDSYEMAKSYLKDAVSSKNAPKEVIEKANKYLAKIQ